MDLLIRCFGKFFVCLSLIPTASAVAATITNGDFELGDTGFSSQYAAANPNTDEGQYTVRSDPQNWNINFNATPDHTSGSGNMMVINGALDANLYIWQQVVAVTPSTNYDFSAWVSTAVAGGPADLILKINNVTVGGSFVAPNEVGTWVNWNQTWSSGGANSATLQIFDINTSEFPNDFYLDDISFEAVPVPAAVWLFGSALAILGWMRRKST